jgi:uncharacterized protein (TIGR02145 family)
MKYIRVRIVIGTSSGVFDIYHDEIDINKRALLQSNGQPAIGITFDELSDLNGILVSVPDESESIIVTSDPDSFCSENGGVNNDSYTIPIGCYTYAVTSKFGVSTYTYIDCECNEIVASIDGSNGQIQQTFCALYGTVNAGDLELTFIQGCETVSIELCYDEDLPELACDCDPTPTPTSPPPPTPTQIVDPCTDCVANDVTIGSQIWTGCNLDVTTYRDGTPIPQVTDPNQWANLTTGAWCYYNNDPANGAIYGKLYNVYAIIDPRGLAPVGYHIPSDAEWTTLTATLGGGTWIDTWGTNQSFFQAEVGNLLKQANNCHWDLLSGQTDPYGFTALPGGAIASAGYFVGEGSYCDFGSSTLTGFSDNETWYYRLEGFFSGIDKLRQTSTVGVSIRLIKD